MMKKLQLKKPRVLIGGVVVLGIAAAGVYAQSHYLHHASPANSATASTGRGAGAAGSGLEPSAATSNQQAHSGAAGATATAQVVSSPGHPVSSTLAQPTGEVLNLNTISLSKNPNMNSSCNTVIGGMCGLKATGPGGTVKTVSPTATNAQGTNDFDWTAKGLGLSQGNWSVQLLATDNGQTSLSDAYQLTVQP